MEEETPFLSYDLEAEAWKPGPNVSCHTEDDLIVLTHLASGTLQTIPPGSVLYDQLLPHADEED